MSADMRRPCSVSGHQSFWRGVCLHVGSDLHTGPFALVEDPNGNVRVVKLTGIDGSCFYSVKFDDEPPTASYVNT